jgi:iron complex outermembrane receptor protein
MMILRPYGDNPAIDIAPEGIDGNEKTLDRYSVELNHDLSWGRLTAISSLVSVDTDIYKGYGTRESEALFGFPFDYLATDSGEEDAFNQDLRLSSLPEADIFWVAGINIARTKRTFDSTDEAAGTRYDRRFDTHGDAIYGEITYPVADAWRLTGGWRHSRERKNYQATYDTPAGITPDRRRLSDNYDTGRVALSYAMTPSTNLYAVLSRGYKPGGFNDYATQVLDSEPYRAAVVNSAEVGFKAATADGALDLAGAVFFNRVKDDHLLGFDFRTMATYAVNADTESRGAELEGSWRPGGGLTLSGGASYIDATITKDVLGVSGGPVDSGNQVPDVPRWSTLLAVGYRQALPDMPGLAAPLLNLQATHRYVGPRPADAQNSFDLDAYHKLDVHLGLIVGGAELYFWGDNLLDEQYDLFGYSFSPTITVGLPARGRTLGMGVSYAF